MTKRGILNSHTPPDPTKPLQEARIRLEQAAVRKRRKPRPSADLIIGMAAAGIPKSRAARAVGVTAMVMNDILAEDPQSNEKIRRYREALKLQKITYAHKIEGKMWDFADRMIEKEDPKGLDATLRALHASEKVQASVAGEGQKVEVTGGVPQVDLKVLIANILGEQV